MKNQNNKIKNEIKNLIYMYKQKINKCDFDINRIQSEKQLHIQSINELEQLLNITKSDLES